MNSLFASALLLVSLLATTALAGVKSNVAVLAFTGDKTVTSEQLGFMTGKFTSELVATNAFLVLERSKMEFILQEQGFQQSGACNSSECKVQVGQLLGVDCLVSGNLVNFGGEYALHVEFIDVGTGQIVKTVDIAQKGTLQSVYMDISREAAGRLAAAVQGTTYIAAPSQHQVPADAIPSGTKAGLSLKRKLAIGLWGTALAGSGVGIGENFKGEASLKDYKSFKDEWKTAPSENLAVKYTDSYRDVNNAKLGRNIGYGVSLSSLVLGTILWFLPEGK